MNEHRFNPIIDIALPPVEQWELRIIIWDAKNCAIKDVVTNQNDLYVRVTPQMAAKIDNPKKSRLMIIFLLFFFSQFFN